MQRQVLAIREKALDPGHLQTAVTLNRLAQALTALARFSEAETLYQRSITISEKNSSAGAPEETAIALRNLGDLWITLGRLQAAEPLIQRALTIHEKALGPEHDTVAKGLNTAAT
jgi:tetratricopeptide (TPR) repeat protein